MTIQTQPGHPSLDQGDFQYTFNGVTFGLKLRHFPAIDGVNITSLIIAEKVGDAWVFKEEVDRDFLPELESNMSQWMAKTLAKINGWIVNRFTGVVNPPAGVPQSLIALDSSLKNLRVEIKNGIPQLVI